MFSVTRKMEIKPKYNTTFSASEVLGGLVPLKRWIVLYVVSIISSFNT